MFQDTEVGRMPGIHPCISSHICVLSLHAPGGSLGKHSLSAYLYQTLVVQAWNPWYSGGRDKRMAGSRPAWAAQ